MIPEVIFRNLDVPMHIIDPVEDDDFIPVSHENRVLKEQHLDLVVHEIYEETGHGAHIERSERFIDSAQALLKRVRNR